MSSDQSKGDREGTIIETINDFGPDLSPTFNQDQEVKDTSVRGFFIICFCALRVNHASIKYNHFVLQNSVSLDYHHTKKLQHFLLFCGNTPSPHRNVFILSMYQPIESRFSK